MKKKTTAMMCSSSLSSSSYLFSLLHEDLIIDEILLKLPLNSLLSLRCVSWYFHSLITSPSFIKKHLHHNNSAQHSLLLISSYVSFRWDDLGSGVYHHYTFNFSTSSSTDDPSRPQVIQIMHCPFESTGGIQASCNGLLFLDNRKGMLDTGGPAGYIWNPCNPKEYKEVILPPPPPSSNLIQQHEADLFEGIQVCQVRADRCRSGFCGFGYDSINEEYKILYYENRVGYLPVPDEVSRIDNNLVSITEFKLYKLGTNTWTRICSDNPFRYLFFGHLWRRIGSYVNGALHWIMSSSLQPSSCCCAKKSKFIQLNTCCVKNAKIISFDMNKEEFREIQKPRYYYKEEDEQQCYSRYEALQVLQGCLCICEFLPPGCDTTDIWMLKDYAVKASWTKLFTIVLSNEPKAIWNFRLLRLCENGEIVMTSGGQNNMIVYDPVKHISRRVENLDKSIKNSWRYEVFYVENLDKSIKNSWRYEVFYTESLVSLSSYIS